MNHYINVHETIFPNFETEFWLKSIGHITQVTNNVCFYFNSFVTARYSLNQYNYQNISDNPVFSRVFSNFSYLGVFGRKWCTQMMIVVIGFSMLTHLCIPIWSVGWALGWLRGHRQRLVSATILFLENNWKWI